MSGNHQRSNESDGGIKIAFFLNLAFTIVEIIGGYWTNSLAILSDALHDLGDCIALGLAWFLDRYSKRTSDRLFSYGYTRFSLLGALINAIILVSGSIVILSQAVPRLFNPVPPRAGGMVLLAVIGVIMNGVAAVRVRRGRSLNAQVVSWHLLEDVIGWLLVLVVSIVLLFWDVPILDSILSVALTLYVLYNVVGRLRVTLKLFLQGVPEQVDVEDVERRLLAIDGVRSAHHTHIWSLDGEHHVLTTHAVVNSDSTLEDVRRIKAAIREITTSLGMEHTTIEIEYDTSDCSMNGC